jgi:tetratricopeptide (TPR) repeat protein
LTQSNSRLANDRLADARRYIQKGDRRRAYATLKDAAELDPNNKIVAELMAETRKAIVENEREEALNLYSNQKYKEALERFNYLLEVDPKASDLAGYREETKKRLAELNQAEAERLNREGLKAYDQGKIKEAINYWKKALEISPDHVNAKRNLDRAQQQLKE